MLRGRSGKYPKRPLSNIVEKYRVRDLKNNLLRDLLGNYTASTHISGNIIAFKIVITYTAHAGMNEFKGALFIIGAYHDAYVAYILTTAAAGEKYEVALAELIARYGNTLCVLNA